MDSLIQSFEAWITKKIDERLTVQVNTRTTQETNDEMSLKISKLHEAVARLDRNKVSEHEVATSLEHINDRVSENEDTINIRVSELEDTINDLDAINIDSVIEQVSENLVITTR